MLLEAGASVAPPVKVEMHSAHFVEVCFVAVRNSKAMLTGSMIVAIVRTAASLDVASVDVPRLLPAMRTVHWRLSCFGR